MLVTHRRKIGHPDVACMLAQREHDFIPGNCDVGRTQIQVSPRKPSAVEVLDAQGRAGFPLRHWVEPLRPQTWRAVAIGPEVEQIAIWRPAWRITILTDQNPFFFGSHRGALYSRDKGPSGRPITQPRIERKPIAAWGKPGEENPKAGCSTQ